MLSAGGPTLKNTFVSKKVLWLNYNEKAQRAVIFKVSSASAGRKGDEFRIQYVYLFAIAFFFNQPLKIFITIIFIPLSIFMSLF